MKTFQRPAAPGFEAALACANRLQQRLGVACAVQSAEVPRPVPTSFAERLQAMAEDGTPQIVYHVHIGVPTVADAIEEARKAKGTL